VFVLDLTGLVLNQLDTIKNPFSFHTLVSMTYAISTCV